MMHFDPENPQESEHVKPFKINQISSLKKHLEFAVVIRLHQIIYAQDYE